MVGNWFQSAADFATTWLPLAFFLLVAFMAWALTDGQALEKDLGFAPLPAAVDAKALTELHSITSGGTALWP